MPQRLFPPLFALFIVFAMPVMGADFQKGVDAAERGDFTVALREWKPLAEQGNADAQHNLGQMYRSGQGVVKNHKEASKWFSKAAEKGHASAQYYFGVMYAGGQGVVHRIYL